MFIRQSIALRKAEETICTYTKNEIKTSGNESINETKNDLFLDWVPPIGIKEN